MAADQKFENELLQESHDVLQAIIPKMTQIWRQLGFPPGKSQERFAAAISHHKELWESMLEEEKNNKKKIVTSIDRLGRHYHQLGRELGIVVKDLDSDAPLLEMEKCLNDAIAELMREKEERMKNVRILFEHDDVLCGRLELPPFNINREKIPTTEQMNLLQDHITQLENEIILRQQQFVSVRDDIKCMMQQLETSARSSFEVEMFVSDSETVCLSSDNIMKMKECQADLKARHDRCIIKANVLRCKIGTLWERLNVEQVTQDMFLADNKGFSPSTIAVLEQELAHLEEEKMKHIEQFIKAVRHDILMWWEKCFTSEGEQKAFTPFSSNVYTEDLLNLHENLAEKLKMLHGANKEIFTKVAHRENLWKRMEDIEARGRDPTRLFGNRGCALLLEEKERKKIMKELPRVEEQLIQLLDEYEKNNGSILLINGRDYRCSVTEQWTFYEEQKENEKLQRQRERQDKLVEESKGGAKPTTPMKRRLGTTGLRTQLESPKSSKQRRVAPISSAPANRTGRRILTEALVNQLHCKTEVHETSTISTYSAFTEALAKKQGLSSTILDSNKTTPMKSRQGTPMRSFTPSTLPRRRSPRLASRSPGRLLTPTRSTPKLALSKNHRPFLC